MSNESKTFRFEDHFSGHSEQYAQHRPHYPDGIYAYLASITPGRSLAWDCGTGNGQAAIGLANYFDRVHATDASAGQISQAHPHANVEYSIRRLSQQLVCDSKIQCRTRNSPSRTHLGQVGDSLGQ